VLKDEIKIHVEDMLRKAGRHSQKDLRGCGRKAGMEMEAIYVNWRGEKKCGGRKLAPVGRTNWQQCCGMMAQRGWVDGIEVDLRMLRTLSGY